MIMQGSLLPKFEYGNISSTDIKKYIEQHWFRLILIGFGLYIVLVKDINLQVSMNSASQESVYEEELSYEWEDKVIEPEVKAPKRSTEFSVVDGILFFEGGKGEKTLPAALPMGANNQAINFSNLTFIMSPDYAERKNIPASVVADKKRKVTNYVNRFAAVAIKEMETYGIPASITLAQGLLESNVGESRLVRSNKNHFGIKCFSRKCKKGHCSNFTDDTHKDFFRIYASSWDSYRAHSLFLQGKRYAHLKKLGTTNYKAWAKGLKEAGYATDQRYAKKLIQIIETLNLYQFDKVVN